MHKINCFTSERGILWAKSIYISRGSCHTWSNRVVSALTMPALVQHFKDMVLISQAKKSYTNFLNVIKRMEAENECTNYADIFATGESAAQIAKI